MCGGIRENGMIVWTCKEDGRGVIGEDDNLAVCDKCWLIRRVFMFSVEKNI